MQLMRNPVILMTVSILAYSLFPLLGALGIQNAPPLVYIGFSQIAALGAFSAISAISARGRGSLRAAAKLFRRDPSFRGNVIADGILNVVSHFLLLLSFLYLNKTAATVIYETWPILGMIATSILLSLHFGRLEGRSLALGMVALVGLALVVWSGEPASSSLDTDGQALLGVVIAAGAAVSMALSVSTHVKARLILDESDGAALTAVVTNVLTKTVGSLFFLVCFAFVHPFDLLATIDPFVWGLILVNGVFIVAIGSVAYSEALAIGARSELILLWYLTPLFAVAWLWGFGLSTVSETLILGGLFIVAANVLLHSEADEGPAYIAVFLVLCAVAALVHVLPPLALGDYVRNASLIDLISLPLAIFGILAGFTLNRHFSRRQEQEEAFLAIAPHLTDPDMELIERMMTSDRQAEIDHYYVDLYQSVIERQAGLGIALSRFRVKLGRVVSHGELMVHWTLGIMASLAVVTFRPAGFVGDMIAIMTVTSVIYLVMLISSPRNYDLITAARRIHDPLCSPGRSKRFDRRVATVTLIVLFAAQLLLAFERDGVTEFFTPDPVAVSYERTGPHPP